MIHRGFEAWVAYADGQPLPEFDAEFSGRQAVCYIPSKRGKRFILCWKYHSGEHRVAIRVTIDGVNVGCKTCRPGGAGRRIGMRTGSFSEGAYHAFEFADLLTVAGDDAGAFLRLSEGDGARISESALGTICVQVYHIESELRPAIPHPSRPAPFPGMRAVVGHESDADKKWHGDAVNPAHCVRLGRKLCTQWSENAKEAGVIALLNKDEGPYITFEFRYRPAVALQAKVQGIMPTSDIKSLADDEAEESASDEDSLTLEAQKLFD
ncbi:hypothetical protein BN946_scf184583.g8 [Trametes cinnabarina]|uniref:DUF7918 domain-containing protein n=1 Tax=Pycnoporus cinnabarinus TaxID=5643 RepID=A0A060SK49_PYCCI|nr:hypothetical protein BN946_scf184583.g8 [Trametes cinnabarina]